VDEQTSKKERKKQTNKERKKEKRKGENINTRQTYGQSLPLFSLK